MSRSGFSAIRLLAVGDAVSLPLMDGKVATGIVDVTRRDDGWLRVGGELRDGNGRFAIGSNGTAVTGLILLKREKLAYEITEQKDGQLWMLEKALGEVVCDPMPREPGPVQARREGASAAVPILNSRPGVTADVLYLDFDGEVVTDSDWGNINAASYNFSTATINAIFDRVKEDWYPFNINVTTDLSNYTSAAAGHRMRVIITPTDTAAPGAGGVAFLRSFRQAGSSFDADVPCWVFNSGVVGVAEAISHEVGHTMGLSHDGRDNVPGVGHEEYYEGQGSGAVGWCPIMGAGYYKNLVQWSKGEYALANNQEDDLAIISASYNHFGYVPDDAGNTRASAAALSGNPTTGAVSQAGVIERTADADFYTFFTNGGAATITATDPSSSPDLDIVLELQDAQGLVIQTNNPATSLGATVSATLAAGQYYVKVSPTGAGNPVTTGYSDYGSIGQYVLGGTISGLTQNPIVTSASTASGQVGVSFSYRIKATGNPASFGVNGTLPPGLAFDSASGLIVGYPTQAGTFPVDVSATNASGTGTRTVTITIADAALTLGEALDFTAVTWTTSPAAPWVGEKTVTFDGDDAAQAAAIGDGEESSFSTTISGPVTVEFQWKVSSEENGDYLSVDVDGTVADSISGVVDWSTVSVPISSGSHTITWTYRKNSGISQDPDTAWVDAVKFLSTVEPEITSPSAAVATVGNAFNYQITADHIPSSYALASGALPLGFKLDSGTGLISGVASASGVYNVTLTATNNVGDSLPFGLEITVNASTVTLEDAVEDSTPGAYSLSSDPANAAAWFPETVTTHDGIDALQSGPIGPNESTSLTKTVSGINTVNFWWKVEAQPPNDRVRFTVDGDDQNSVSLTGVTGWENVSYYVGPGTHSVVWKYEKGASGSLGADAAFLDQVVFTTDLLPLVTSSDTATGTQGTSFAYLITADNDPTFFTATGLPDGLQLDSGTGQISGVPTVTGGFDVEIGAGNLAGTSTKNLHITLGSPPVTLKQSLDAPTLIWTTDPAFPWLPQTVVSYDGLHSARSGAIPHGGKSYLETHVTGPITVKFRWTVDSEQNKDFLRFYIDGVFQSQISGPLAPTGASTSGWELKSFTVGSGDHTLRWIYSKDPSAVAGRDSGWVDQVTLENGSSLPVITSPLTATAYLGRDFKYQITATNSSTIFGASPLPGNLVLDSGTGLITGTPQTAAVTNVSISGTNASGPGTAAALVLTVAPEPPGADAFANATALSGVAVRVEGTNTFASAEIGEPAHAGRPAKASLWYSWTAPLTGSVNIATFGSDVDTLLSVYRGTTLANLSVVKENDDAGKFVTSAVKFDAVAGTTYVIAVDALNGTAGRIVLNINYTATGLYSGLLKDTNAVAPPGLATVSLTSQLGFSGALQFGTKKFPFKGGFVGEDFTGPVSRGRGVTPAQLTLHLDLSPGAEEITGSAAVDGVTYNLFAKLALTKSDVPAGIIGAFTFVIEPDDTVTAGLPRGVGYGSATIDKSGKVKTGGMLADGTKFTSGGNVATDSSWILFLTPYKAGGVCAGEVLIDAGALFPPLSSTIDWARSADSKAKLFRNGFGPTTATLKGFRYTKPAKDVRVLVLNPTTHQVDFSFGASDLPASPAAFTATLNTKNKFEGGPAGFKWTLVPATGLLNGSIPDAQGNSRAFGGAILQSSSATQGPPLKDSGAGFYFGVTTTGSIRLAPTP